MVGFVGRTKVCKAYFPFYYAVADCDCARAAVPIYLCHQSVSAERSTPYFSFLTSSAFHALFSASQWQLKDDFCATSGVSCYCSFGDRQRTERRERNRGGVSTMRALTNCEAPKLKHILSRALLKNAIQLHTH